VNEDQTRWRPLILFSVLLCHVSIIVILLRSSPHAPLALDAQPVTLLRLNAQTNAAPFSSTSVMTDPHPALPAIAVPRLSSVPDASSEPAPAEPPIDWMRETELTASNALAAEEKQSAVRNLSGPSEAQLSWNKRNHMQPMPPGIQWARPRVEITPEGLPLFWINEHCVVVPLMAFMVFCSVGHIEPNGHMLDHMRDPREP
jgi:hypothetical protein